MTGALIIAIAIVIVLPVAFLMTAGLLTVVMSWFLNEE